MNIYDFNVKNKNDEQVPLSNYKGKVLLIVNTASKCGLTPQFESLEKLYKEYGNEKFEILGFPCSQFANQEFEAEEEIQNFCKVNYGVTFPVFAKIDVNGKNEHPLYKYLKQKAPGIMGSNIKWNFTKFLINSEGEVVKRYSPTTEPLKLEKDITQLIK